MTRRGLLAGLSAGAAALALPRRARADAGRVLVLGASGYVGQKVVEAAEARGLDVHTAGETLAPPGHFGAVLDCASSHPDLCEARAADLCGRFGHYVRLSTAEAYADAELDADRVDERATLRASPTTGGRWTDAERHAEVERRLARQVGPRLSIVRPTAIVGPDDPTDRLAAWIARTAEGGTMVAPGRPSDPVQLIDVRDVAAFMVERIGRRSPGLFNLAGPRRPATMAHLLASCARATGVEPHIAWVPEPHLSTVALDPAIHLPLWHSPDDPLRGVARLDTHRARGAGLHPRPLDETVADTARWWNALPLLRREARRAGLDPRREVRLRSLVPVAARPRASRPV